jgi:hypothetical protein
MKRTRIIVWAIALLAFFQMGVLAQQQGFGAFAQGAPSCAACHESVAADLPKDHPPMELSDRESMARIKEVLGRNTSSPYLEGIHRKKGVTCLTCHVDVMPEIDAAVENETCLGCHDSYGKLAEMTANQEDADKNPHNSHLGEIGCTVCHHAHRASQVYCLTCHSNFEMTIPGSEPQKRKEP